MDPAMHHGQGKPAQGQPAQGPTRISALASRAKHISASSGSHFEDRPRAWGARVQLQKEPVPRTSGSSSARNTLWAGVEGIAPWRGEPRHLHQPSSGIAVSHSEGVRAVPTSAAERITQAPLLCVEAVADHYLFRRDHAHRPVQLESGQAQDTRFLLDLHGARRH